MSQRPVPLDESLAIWKEQIIGMKCEDPDCKSDPTEHRFRLFSDCHPRADTTVGANAAEGTIEFRFAVCGSLFAIVHPEKKP